MYQDQIQTARASTVLHSDPFGAAISLNVPLCPPAPLPSNGKTIMTIGVPDACQASFSDLHGIPVPRPGMRTLKDGSTVISHQPVAFADAAAMVRSVMAYELSAAPLSECYSLAGFDRETGIAGQIDHTHTSPTDFPIDEVGAN